MRAFARFVSRVCAPAIAVVAGFAVPATAGAATVEVVDADGRPQVAAVWRADDPWTRWWTGADGRVDVGALAPGTQLRVSRAPGETCGGWEEVAAAAGSGGARVVLRSLVRAAVAPHLDAQERRLLDLLTAHRARLGRPTRHAPALDLAADRYVGYLARMRTLGHCLLGSPTARAHASGFTGATVHEDLSAGGPDVADEHFGRWLRSPAHRLVIERPEVATVGVAHVGGFWALLVSGDCREGVATQASGPHDRPFGASCGWSPVGVSGPALPPPGRNDWAADEHASGNPHLRVALRRAGRRLKVRARVARGAHGSLRVSARHGDRVVRRRLHEGRARTLRLTPGRWRVRVTFRGDDGWRSARAGTTVRIPPRIAR